MQPEGQWGDRSSFLVSRLVEIVLGVMRGLEVVVAGVQRDCRDVLIEAKMDVKLELKQFWSKKLLEVTLVDCGGWKFVSQRAAANNAATATGLVRHLMYSHSYVLMNTFGCIVH